MFLHKHVHYVFGESDTDAAVEPSIIMTSVALIYANPRFIGDDKYKTITIMMAV